MNPQTHIASLIRQGVHAIMAVHDEKYNFAYTVGLTEHGLPELLIFGVSGQTAHIILNVAAYYMRENGEFKDGQITDELGTMPNSFKSVRPDVATRYACQAGYRYESLRVQPRYLQVVLPDRAGKMPWDAGFDGEHMNKFQPQLWTE